MSSHREAPEISKDPVADSADLYAFVSPDNPSTVTIIANYVPLQQPAGGPNFYEFGDDVLYEIHIDNDNDAESDITYQFKFTTRADRHWRQRPVPLQHRADQAPERHDVEPQAVLFGDPRRQARHPPAWRRTWRARRATSARTRSRSTRRSPQRRSTRSARAASSSRVSARTASTSTSARSSTSATSGPSSLTSCSRDLRPPASTPLAGLNVHSIAIQVPIKDLTLHGTKPSNYKASDSTIGVWTTASRQKTKILGHPSTPARGPRSRVSATRSSTRSSSRWARRTTGTPRHPHGDSAFSHYYDHPTLAALLNVLYPGAFPNLAAYTAKTSNTRPDLDAVLLTGVPPLFPGFQNYTGSDEGRHAPAQRGHQAHLDREGEHPRRRRW